MNSWNANHKISKLPEWAELHIEIQEKITDQTKAILFSNNVFDSKITNCYSISNTMHTCLMLFGMVSDASIPMEAIQHIQSERISSGIYWEMDWNIAGNLNLEFTLLQATHFNGAHVMPTIKS